MNQPLSYTGFILCLVLITICFIVAVYLSYRKSSRLRDMVQFVISPKDDLALDFKIPSIIKTALWFFIIHISITVVYHFADLLLYGETVNTSIENAVQTMPFWLILVIPPIVEEIAFRLPLKRKRLYITLSSAAIMFFISAIIFSTKVYDVTWERLLLCAIIALIAWFWGYKLVSKVNFKTWLWILVLSFSILHIINYDLSTMDIGGWIRVILKEAVKIPSALMFCYVRIKHGFGTSVALHFSINLLVYYLSNQALSAWRNGVLANDSYSSLEEETFRLYYTSA